MFLKENVSEPKEDNVERINYKDFKVVESLIGSTFSQFFTATTFLKFDKDKYGRLDIVSFFHYIVKKCNIEQNKISLLVSDTYG
jgi:serine/threonine-protein phosphatase 2A regulatory subunit B''